MPEPAAQQWTAPASIASGIVAVIAAGAFLASMDATGKFLSARYGVLPVVWSRYAVHAVLVFAWLAARRGNAGFLRARRPGLQLLRGLALLGVTVCMYTALVHVPLASATAVMFFAPVLVTLLAGVLLGERIGGWRIAAVLSGFSGVLLIVRPGLSTDWHMMLPLLAAVFLAGYLLLTRHVSSRDNADSTLFHSTALAALALTLVIPWYWETPTTADTLRMLMMGGLGALGHGCIVLGFARAPASVLSPFLYSQILAASVLGILVFGDVVGPLTVAGATLLIAGGVINAWREARAGRG